MNNLQRFNKAFMDSLGVNESELKDISYKGIPEWDSVGHMGLISKLEEEFDILIDADDMFEIKTYTDGKRIMGKYGINL